MLNDTAAMSQLQTDFSNLINSVQKFEEPVVINQIIENIKDELASSNETPSSQDATVTIKKSS